MGADERHGLPAARGGVYGKRRTIPFFLVLVLDVRLRLSKVVQVLSGAQILTKVREDL